MSNIQLYPLTNAQQRIWYSELLYPNTSVSQLSGTVKMKGKLNITVFMKAVNMIIEQYDALRIRITSNNGIPQQYVVSYTEKQFDYFDFADFSSVIEAENWLESQKNKPLPLLDSELFQFLFIKINEEEYWLNTKLHHIIADGISMVIFGNQLTEYYIEMMNGNNPELGENCSYIDYITIEKNYEDSEKYIKDQTYWLDKFADLPEQIGGKSYNPLSVSTSAVREHFKVPSMLYQQITQFCQEQRISIFQFFMGMMYIYIHKTTNQSDVTIGTSLANRGSKKEKQTVGMFVSTIAARMDINQHMDILQFLKNVTRDQMSILRHQKYPYNQLIQDLREKHHAKDLQRLFNISMEYRPVSWVDVEGVRISTDYDFCGDEINDFVLHIAEIVDDSELVLHVDYRTELFDQKEIARMIDQLLMITKQSISNPQGLITDISLLNDTEKATILSFSEDMSTNYPKQETIHHLFEKQSTRNPDHIAVQMGNKSLTYRELNQQSNRLARQLRDQGIQADTLVGIMVERSLEMIVGILAILKAGGAYVPIDPEYPKERIQYIINDSSISVLLTQSHLQNNTLFNGNYIYIDHAVLEDGDDSNLISISGPNHLAYVIYTSGTTGQPKGTLIEHKNVVRLFFNDRNLFDFSNKDVWTLFHSYCFDFSVWEMYGAILHGGKLIIVPSNIAKNPEIFLDLLKINKVTILNQTPSYFYQLLQNELKHQTNDLHLRNIIFGGEALNPSLLQKWREKYPYIKLINMYGITETTVHVTYKEINEPEILSGKSNIGITIPTLNAYILDEQYRLQPIGVPGELYISGEGLARGYLNLPEVTSERFISHPLRSNSDERVYRTGDLARWLPDGNIEYLGRIDHQVKIRGYRIELGEIESQILKIDEVQETIVIARLDDQQQYLLCAYYVTSTYLEPSILRKMLNQVMPAYMIPSYFVHLDHMPLTSNGKLDRNALPEPVIREQSDQEYIAPRTIQETQLVEIWKNVLGSQNISVLDNFFEIGGHSLRATQVSSKIHQELNVEISLRDIFQAPTIEKMAILLTERSSTVYISIPKATQNEYYPVSSAQKRLYVLNQLEGGELSYNMTGVFTVEGKLDRERLLSAFNQLINNHESLRTSFSLIDGEPVQHIHSEVVFDIEQLDMKNQTIDNVISSFVRPFDLHQAPLIRVGLTSQKENKCLFLIDMHHIISDGISVTLLTKELTRLYQDEQINVSSIQYKDYAVWQRQQIEQNSLVDSEKYWLNIFENDLPVLDIPLDYPRPSVRSFEGNTLSFIVDEEDTVALNKLANQTETTLYMVLLAAYSTFLYKYTAQEDIIIGSPVAGRAHTELDNVIGMFVNTLALRTYPTGEKTFNDYLYEVKETVLQSFEHQYYPLEILVDKLQLDRDPSRNPIFDTLFVLQNTEQTDDQMSDLQLELYPYTPNIAKFDLSLHVVEQENQLIFSFEYATALYHPESIERFATHLKHLLQIISNDQHIKLNKIEVITPIEKKQIIESFNATAISYPHTHNIYDLFKEQVNRNPNQTALVYEEKTLTYKELDEKSGRLAQTLFNSGIKPQQAIAMISHRSIEMVIAMLATLRIGAVYVPIDPDYPFERVNYMLHDTQALLLLFNDASSVYDQYGIPVIDLTKPESYASTIYISENNISARDLAYIMYTSGTTGNPKGVMIEHRSVIRLVKNTNYIQLDENTKILQTGAVAFDASTFEVWGSLLNGGQLYFIGHHDLLIAEKLKKAIDSYQINTMWLTSPLFNQLSQEDEYLFNGIQTLLIGGDVLSASHINAVLNKNPQLVILNGYGPTENTTFSTIYRITETVESNIPIGQPISNSTAYVVDQGISLQPVGAWGELIVGGDGIARGYLNLPEMTKEKFVSDFMYKDQTFYRTGDLARWKSDGTLEYKGRIDEQVKIRGYRIELSEVEAKLLQMDTIQSATVIVHKNEYGEKQLCAYYVSNDIISSSEIRIAMVQSVPSYMIPSYFVKLEQIPLTENGKVNRRLLPVPHNESQTGQTHVDPKTEEEKILVNIWKEVLGINAISIHDNFFELGGDSIKAIQVSSRLLQVGYRLEMKELFKSSNIAQLASLLQVIISQADQEPVQGEVLLNPIQTWFLNRSEKTVHHFNQSVILYKKEKFDEKILHQVMTTLVEHHDALRLVFHHEGEHYTAYNRDINEGKYYDLQRIDLHNQADPGADIRSWADRIQSSIDLDQGPLVKLGLFQCIDGDHLLMVIHHLVIDGISWRILLEDMRKLYGQFSNGEAIVLPFKTDSFQKWTASLSKYAQSGHMNVHQQYWSQWQNISFEPLPKDMHTEEVLLQDSRSVIANLTVQETTQFITEAHRAYKTEPNDLLLSALSIALNQWSGLAKIAINLEGHGRESIIEDIDITRTVGWFTSQFPVILEYAKEMDTSTLIQKVKENLREIPAKGIGYGLLRYQNNKIHSFLQIQPEISFNYLGQFDQDLESNEWQLSNYSMGNTQDPTSPVDYVLDINGMIIDNSLSLTITYNANQYRSETINQLVHILQDSLRAILKHCLEQRYTQLTPSDVQVKGISTQDLKELSQRTCHLGIIQNVYTLTPMQKGMLFHYLLDGNEGAYFEQAAFDFEGDFNAELFGQSLNKLVARHDILRTHFYNDIGIEPLQVVFEKRQVEINYEDIRGMDNLQCNLYLETVATSDKRRGFDFEKDLLLRMSIIRTKDQTFRILWSFHHIIMDGWCIPLITREVFENYFALVEGKEFNPTNTPAYSQYIEWIEKQDKEEAASYWTNYLSDYNEQTLLPQCSITNQRQEYNAQKFEYVLSEEFTLKLENVAREAKVTMNILIQSIWGIVLQRYNNSHDVVYGTVVSGRPAEISGIEKMIGLFINTIPVRVNNDTNISFSTLMKMQQDQYLSAQPYSTYPLFEIQAQTTQKQDLISHILVFENYPIEKEIEQLSEKNKQFKIHDVELLEQSNYDFNLLVLPGKQLKFIIQYNDQVYKDSDIQRIQGHIVHLLEQVIVNANIPINNLELITAIEQKQLIDAGQSNITNHTKYETIHKMLEQQVLQIPNQMAVVQEGKSLTYHQLNSKANKLAQTLLEEGIKSGENVVLLAERSIDMIVGMYGIMKAGCVYIPVDPSYPAERIRYMLEDSQATAIITQTHLKEYYTQDHTVIDLSNIMFQNKECLNLNIEITENDLAYMIYTSGTTGQPKGVMIEHRGAWNLANYYQAYFEVTSNDRIIQFASSSFDASVSEIIMALSSGASLYIPSTSVIMDYMLFEQFMNKYEITIATLPPTYAIYLDPERFPTLRCLLTAGSAASIELINKWKQHVRYYNAYGPTEDSVCTTIWSVDETEDISVVSIGTPIANHQIYILDEQLRLQPVGVSGELYIGGIGLARGYYGKQDMTNEKFVPHLNQNGQKMYRTGDQVRWLEDGTIEYLGRIDHQVKIRGYRIEPAEVETQLLQLDHLQETIVIALNGKDNQQELCAYFVADQLMDIKQIQSDLSNILPSYMIPSRMMQLEKMPITPNGKISRQHLPEIVHISANHFSKPTNQIQQQLISIWEKVLSVHNIGIDDNFFDLGGHSLKAALMISKIRKEMNYDISLKVFFQTPTIQDIEMMIQNQTTYHFEDIPLAGNQEYYPISSAQKRLFILNQMEGGEISYNMPGILKIEGKLNSDQLEQAFIKLIERHDSLRTCFVTVNGEPVQKIMKNLRFSLEHVSVNEEQLDATIHNFIRPFVLEEAPLLRVSLIQLQPESHILMFDMHHIISDAISMNILIKEIIELYQGIELSPLPIQYTDYAVWQQNQLESVSLHKQEAYWLERFNGHVPILDLATDKVRPAIREYEGNKIQFKLDDSLSYSLRQLAEQTQTTLFMVLLATYKTLLHKYTGQEDIIVGSPIAGRSHASLQHMIGMFVGTLPLRTYPADEKTFEEYLLEIKETALNAYENQDYPFEDLVRQLDLQRDTSRHPLFDTMFVLQNVEENTQEIEGLNFTTYDSSHSVAKFDLTLTASEQEQAIELTMDYSTSIYKKETIQRMIDHLIEIMRNVTTNRKLRLLDINMMTAQERTDVLTKSVGIKAHYPNTTIHQLFEQQAALYPEAIAVVDEYKQLTYQQLNERANGLARTLRQQGVGADCFVGIIADRSVDMIVSIIATLKAGGAYVPIDIDYPEERIRFMLEDSNTQVLLLHHHHRKQVTFFEGNMIEWDQLESYNEDYSNLDCQIQPNHLAYVIYTSGTTGKPKGTLIEHKNVVRLLFNDHNLFDFGNEDTWSLFHSCCFDFSVWEMYGALLYGGKLVIVSALTAKSPNDFLQLLKTQQVTILNQTPTYFYQLIQEEILDIDSSLHLRMIIFGGEALNPSLLKEWKIKYPATQLINMYGITETTVHVTYKEITEKDIEIGRSNIGTTIPTLSAYILDNQQRLQPFGIAGELYIAGEGLARGYLNRPKMTQAKFIDHVFETGSRMYRSGDLARWLPDGTIEYLGRIDHQVKIRGYRIELGEIETKLLEIDSIREATVIAYEENNQSKALVAYFTADDHLTIQELRKSLAKELPNYMIPSYFVQLNNMPLTANGKLDRKSLPKPEAGLGKQNEYASPRNEVEETLINVWQSVLGAEKIGIEDHFFELGGDSIKAIQISSRLFQAGYQLDIKDLFKLPTIAELSPHLKIAARQIDQSEVEGKVELLPIQQWFFEKQLLDTHHYNHAVMLYREEGFSEKALQDTFNQLVIHHDALRTVFKHTEAEHIAWNRSIDEGELYRLESINLHTMQSEDISNYINHKATEVQQSLNLTQGPLFKSVLFQTTQGDHLLIVIHHLVVDGISWRILFEDIASAYEQAASGNSIILPQKTDSYLQWSKKLMEYAKTYELANEKITGYSLKLKISILYVKIIC
ncbi:non-ribosomal peptide synthetase [Paenibacillus nuruki]|uniref:non-ribosomal peptide synthetase n=1 Tax=Paenibacillus nuruki TaxID=1886670 RepID=UPI0028045901|nr:non-ribosomal peptide synthetase [Paenibacillus nuruki]CAJ1314008.1 Non-ribosomal peptide synthase domain TIGR01720/amino acid adenylation domain-containing protein [Paenibacillus nuruki]